MAGLVTTSTTTGAAAQPVQMLTTTWNTFNHWYFACQMISAIEILIIAGLFLLFKPYIPFVISKVWTHLPVVGVMNKVRNTAPMGGFVLRNGMYRKEFQDTVMYYIKKYLGSYRFMGCAFDIVHRDRGFVQDPVMNKYIVSLASQGYTRWRDIKDALDVNDIDPSSEFTHIIAEGYNCKSYEELRSFLNPYGLTKTTVLYAPKYSNIPQDSLLAYGKDATPGAVAATIDHWFEFTKPDLERSALWEWMPYIILILVLCIGAYILAEAVQMAPKMHGG